MIEPFQPERRPRWRARLLGAVALLVFLGVFGALVLGSADSGGADQAAPTTTRAKPRPKPKPRPTPVSPNVRLSAVGAYDPQGDGSENGQLAALAVDGDAVTSWTTERYTRTFQKSGVGIVLDAGRTVTLRRVSVRTDTPGIRVDIRMGASPTGPFRRVSPNREIGEIIVFPLTKGASGRYVLVWVTALPPSQQGDVNEVVARS